MIEREKNIENKKHKELKKMKLTQVRRVFKDYKARLFEQLRRGAQGLVSKNSLL
jgi:hypothetical protein